MSFNKVTYQDAKILADVFGSSLDTLITDLLENEIEKYRTEIDEYKNHSEDFNQFRGDY